MEKNKEKYMREAIRLSLDKMRAGYGGPFGAVVVRNGEIIAYGFNQVLASNDPTAHAEVDAIRKACATLQTYHLSDCELYTSCEPCPMCFGAIYWARIRKVYYGNTKQDAAAVGFDDNFIYEELKKPRQECRIAMEQLLPEEAIVAFEEWSKNPHKSEY
ncbi:tRNA-specific adenosine deaminase [Adhaeribacter arboris]|uniref:tRNA-specific adenosine deaminase n=1 Tax=Adhaeribacter arboris TaxID=2072846 RepID=A0A2T2YAD7_9BACT|nr:nucleoside deaminase [Adhaeribacter arboris]PSR52464.1 tRNA-specific adenosine deaminase [Adhaeribacter arboris]